MAFLETVMLIFSSIIWANTASGEHASINNHHDISINYSLVEGGYEGESNIDVGPLFIRMATLDCY